MLYENATDRAGQEFVRHRLEQYLSAFPLGKVAVSHTAEALHLSHDLHITVSGMWVGVAEVRVRNQSKTGELYDTDFFRRRGWFFDMPRLKALTKQFYIAGKCTKTVSLVLCTYDKDIFIISAAQLGKRWDKVRKVGPGIGTDNHGDKPNGREGILIPLSIMESIPKENSQ